MVKKWLFIAGLGLAIATAEGADGRIAVVNISGIFQQLPQRGMIEKQLENEFKSRATELQSMERDLQMKIQRLQSQNSTMKASERSLLEQSIIPQRETFSSKALAFEKDNRRRQMEERNKILKHIREAVRKVATEEGYNLVFDTNAIAYSSTAKDITIDVIKQVR